MALAGTNPAGNTEIRGTHSLIACDNEEEDHQKGGRETGQQRTGFSDCRGDSWQGRRAFPAASGKRRGEGETRMGEVLQHAARTPRTPVESDERTRQRVGGGNARL